MTVLAALGLGYCARHLLAADLFPVSRVIGTARTPATAATFPAGVEAHLFDGTALNGDLAKALEATTLLLLSAPPDANGDPALRLAADALKAAPLRQIVYLTTLGVYGDHGGAWVDETTPPRPGSARLQRRVAAEAQIVAFGQARGVPVSILRLAGIYGPGRNALVQLREGEARRIDKPGQVFNRIHVADISRAIAACLAQRFDGIVNVTDDLPAPPADPVAYAAELLGIAPPPLVAFEEAARTMSPMALTFWAANKRVSNARLTRDLGVRLLYPTYREGLAALAASGEGR